ncbi:MAG: hypothetical protein QHI38_12035 [Armatimonadota bacterium]|nr:hypothetical protein [Armatimonadota bacterium]
MSKSLLRGIAVIAFVVAVVVALLLVPSHHPTPERARNDDPWVLVNYNPNDKYGTFLANGFFSTRLMGDGIGSQGGRPLPCFAAGFYDEEKLVPVPTWSDLRFYDGRTRFVVDGKADYKQTLDMRTGIFTTYATWRAGRKKLTGRIQILVSRADPNIALIRAELRPNFSGVVHIRAAETCAEGSLRKLHCALIKLAGGKSATLTVYQTKHSKIALALAVSIPTMVSVHKNARFEINKLVSLSTSADADRARKEALEALAGALANEDAAIERHIKAWEELWKSDIRIEGSSKKQQQIIHSCMFYILSSVREGNKWSIPPMGLSNNAFSGHIFWDADTWIFPALILQHPELARSIVDYRHRTLLGAMKNARQFGMPGAQYAWESGYSGLEVTPEGLPYRHERHINGDVALAQWQYFLATGNLDWLKTNAWPVIKSTADWWVAKAKWNAQKARYEILQVVPPDESAELVNNSVYTNAVAVLNLRIANEVARILGERSNPQWAQVAEKLYIPFDATARRFIAFDGYGSGRFGSMYRAKQADPELVIYPLQFQIPGLNMNEVYHNTFRFYAPRVHKGGPAMTSSVHAVIAARLGDCSRAYAEFVKSYKPFIRGPFNMFNEKPSRYLENMCFLTGAAGPIQAILFGIAGARMDYFGSSELTFKPCLPKHWKKLIVKNIHWRGKTFDLTVLPGNRIQIKPQIPDA